MGAERMNEVDEAEDDGIVEGEAGDKGKIEEAEVIMGKNILAIEMKNILEVWRA
jgi:hypothetical protein